MLSTSNPIKAGRSAEYYREMVRGEYYTGNGQAPGQWFGAGAKALGLVGRVHEAAFKNLLEGRSPDGTKDLVQNAGSEKRQQGWDETFSAVKDLSVLWATAPSLRSQIEACHTDATHPALAYLTDRAGKTRRGKGGHIMERAALVFATFLETVSRELDPQLHTHAVLLNLGVRTDGTTGALWSHDLFVEKMAAGAIYRAQLAANLRRRLGLVLQARRIGFSIEGMPQALGRDFSKRRQAIEALLDQWDDHSVLAAKAAVLATRPRKQMLPRAELEARWQETTLAHGWTEERALRLLGQAQVQPASVSDLTRAVEIEAQRLKVQHRDRKHLVRLGGRLAIELNADGSTLRSFYEEMLPRLLQELQAQTHAQAKAARPPSRKDPLLPAPGQGHRQAARTEQQAQPLLAAGNHRRTEKAGRLPSSRDAASATLIRREPPVSAAIVQPAKTSEKLDPPPIPKVVPAPDRPAVKRSELNRTPAEPPRPARPAEELALATKVRPATQPQEAEQEKTRTAAAKMPAADHSQDPALPRRVPSNPHLPSAPQTIRPEPSRITPRQATQTHSAPLSKTNLAATPPAGPAAEGNPPPDSAHPHQLPIPPAPAAVTPRRHRPVPSVVNTANSPRDVLAEFARKYGVAEPERSVQSSAWRGAVETSAGMKTVFRAKTPPAQNQMVPESAEASRHREAKPGRPPKTRPSQDQQSTAQTPPATPRRTSPSREDRQREARPLPHLPQRKRKLVALAKTTGTLQQGMSALWSEKHGGVMVRSDQGLTLVRFTPAGEQKPHRRDASPAPLNRRQKQQLVEVAKSSGLFPQPGQAHWSDSLQGVMVTHNGRSTVVRLQRPSQKEATGQQFRDDLLSHLQRLPPANRTKVRIERLAFGLGRRAGVQIETIKQTIRSIAPTAQWSFFHVESRPLFANSPVPLLDRFRLPRLVAGRPPRYWGKVRWRVNLLLCELRWQDKYLAPHSPSWSPFHNWRAPVLRLTKENAKLVQQQPLTRPDAKRVDPVREADSQTTQPSPARQPTMEHGY